MRSPVLPHATDYPAIGRGFVEQRLREGLNLGIWQVCSGAVRAITLWIIAQYLPIPKPCIFRAAYQDTSGRGSPLNLVGKRP